MTAINRRPLPAIIEALDDNGLEGIQKNFEAVFAENLMGFRLAEFEAELATLASSRSYLTTEDDGTLSVQAIPIPATDGGTGLVLYAVGDLLYADTTTTLAKLAIAAAGKIIRSNGTLPVYSTFTIPDTYAQGDLLYGSATNTLTALAIAAAGKVIRSNGTLPVYSTFTIPDTYAQGDVIYGSATNVLTALAKDANATRYLSNTGTSNNPAWAQVNLANGVTGTLTVPNGGTGVATFTANGVLYGQGASAVLITAQGAANTVLTANAGAPAFSATPTTTSLTTTGAVTVGTLLDISAAGAGQITFPATQNASSNANTLDDYEEGTWTPVIGGDGGTSGQTYSTQVGAYIKVGQLVAAGFDVTLSAKGTITGNVQIQGLPFASSSATAQVSGILWIGLFTAWVDIMTILLSSSSSAYILGALIAATRNDTLLTTTDITDVTTFRATIVYRTGA